MYGTDALAAQRVVSHHLTAGDFSLDSEKLAGPEFREVIKNETSAAHFAFINIWAPDGTIMFSTDPDIIGRRAKLDGHMRRAFAGAIVSEQTSMDRNMPAPG